MSKPYLLKVDNLSVSFASQIVLTNICFALQAGEIITVIGPNGAGKSTLLRAILGLVPSQSGVIHLIPQLSIGYMPQRLSLGSLMPITVRRFLLLRKNQLFTELPADLLADLAIEHILESPLQNISGGELQRVLLARALLAKPELLILDEPTQGVDLAGQVELYRLINAAKVHYNCGILMVSHDLNLVMAHTTSVLCINKHLCCSGHPAIVSAHPEFIKIFGAGFASELAVYRHCHDHTHSIDGKIIHD